MSRSPVSRRDAATGSACPQRDVVRGAALEETPIWSALYETIRDIAFPAKLPPLELTSKPVPVTDRMVVKTNPWAWASTKKRWTQFAITGSGRAPKMAGPCRS